MDAADDYFALYTDLLSYNPSARPFSAAWNDPTIIRVYHVTDRDLLIGPSGAIYINGLLSRTARNLTTSHKQAWIDDGDAMYWANAPESAMGQAQCKGKKAMLVADVKMGQSMPAQRKRGPGDNPRAA